MEIAIKPVIKMSARDFFLHLGAIAALYVSAGSFIALGFQIINYTFPDVLEGYRDPYSGGIRAAIASLIIIFPLYLILSAALERDYVHRPEKREFAIRKWLLYLTLFVAGIAIVTDLIVLINHFLGGEVTTRFILKVIAVLVVAGFIFGYYAYDLRGALSRPRRRSIAWLAGALVLISLVGGFGILGSPLTQRKLRLDDQRISHLGNVQWQVINHWQQKGNLPARLSELESDLTGYRVPVDPESGKEFEYRVIRQGRSPVFELCAAFSLPSRGGGDGKLSLAPRIPFPSYDGTSGSWEHGSGRHCFERTIDPDMFPAKPR